MAKRRKPERAREAGPAVVLRGLLVPVGGEPRAIELPDAVEGLQAAVGGFFERFAGFEMATGREADCWCDEEGMLKGLPENRLVRLPDFEGVILGPIVITASADEGETYALTDAELEECRRVVRGWLVVE